MRIRVSYSPAPSGETSICRPEAYGRPERGINFTVTISTGVGVGTAMLQPDETEDGAHDLMADHDEANHCD